MNPYIITLLLFIVAGCGVTIWGWTVITRGKKTAQWPSVEGVIEQSQLSSSTDDLLPRIVYSYAVSGRHYQRIVAFPSGTNPTAALASSYVKKYPAGAKIQIHYNPEQPDQATLEPGTARDDWLIFVLGLASTIIGIVFLLFGG